MNDLDSRPSLRITGRRCVPCAALDTLLYDSHGGAYQSYACRGHKILQASASVLAVVTEVLSLEDKSLGIHCCSYYQTGNKV